MTPIQEFVLKHPRTVSLRQVVILAKEAGLSTTPNYVGMIRNDKRFKKLIPDHLAKPTNGHANAESVTGGGMKQANSTPTFGEVLDALDLLRRADLLDEKGAWTLLREKVARAP